MTKMLDWLKAITPRLHQVSDEELSAISDFSLLWSLFEARILSTEGSASAICNVVEAWQRAGALDASSLDVELAYFRQRYFANADFTYHFDHLHLRRNDQVALVRAVISGTNNEPRDRVAAVLIIIFRYRNNLFHGVKWQYWLAGQFDNFTAANNVLMKVLERHGALPDG
jgi:hypothetical protein